MPAHQGGKRFVVLPGHDAVFSDPDPVEEGLVHESAFSDLHLLVGLAAVGEQGYCCIGVGLQPLLVGEGRLQGTFELFFLSTQASLFAAKEVKRDGVGVVGLHELELFSFN
jgi:hypothetical protein